MSDVKIFTYEEIAKHNTREDLYMVISGKVYDITAFVDEHPGGEEVLIDEGARDATGPFDDVGHSEDARELLDKYYIGDVDPASQPIAAPSTTNNVSSSSAPQGNALRILVPLVIIAVWVYFRFLA
ncbi:cytochrome b5-like heme/steroid binding domain-containing protein [Zychaea mexicana]|uniref:cytochrome b5-like heme/steroid binding domain-containing protein n=1 Tax=Zychaea mexicana TaxID=64656 RepID=UPI0022FF3EF0|nr:cytochrome b5-like heme/steroid binding domain-containing protein [Zychaea mexicana]KAI9491375.1 cytochrome b5-like heme/steroid binding domain-containing protein [Zychaea mexicana]